MNALVVRQTHVVQRRRRETMAIVRSTALLGVQQHVQEVVLQVAVARDRTIHRSIPFFVVHTRLLHLKNLRRVSEQQVILSNGVCALEVENVSLGVCDGDVTSTGNDQSERPDRGPDNALPIPEGFQPRTT